MSCVDPDRQIIGCEAFSGVAEKINLAQASALSTMTQTSVTKTYHGDAEMLRHGSYGHICMQAHAIHKKKVVDVVIMVPEG